MDKAEALQCLESAKDSVTKSLNLLSPKARDRDKVVNLLEGLDELIEEIGRT